MWQRMAPETAVSRARQAGPQPESSREYFCVIDVWNSVEEIEASTHKGFQRAEACERHLTAEELLRTVWTEDALGL